MFTGDKSVCGTKSSRTERVDRDEQGERVQVHQGKREVGKDLGRDGHHDGEPRRPLKVSNPLSNVAISLKKVGLKLTL